MELFETKCARCGKPIALTQDPSKIEDEVIRASLIEMSKALICDDCLKSVEHEEREKREAEWQAKLPELYRRAGIPLAFTVMETAPRQDAARWIWNHRRENLLICGDTGTGKTTSVCRVLMRMVQNGASVRYMTFRRLIDELRNRKMSRPADEDISQVDLYFDKLRRHEAVCIDEIVGKVKGGDGVAEAMFDLIDRAYAGESGPLWLVGNVRDKSMEAIFEEEAGAVERRLTTFRTLTLTADGIREG